MSLRHKAINGFAWNLTDKLVNQLGSLAVSIYLARLIGPDGVGLVGLLLIFLMLAQSLVDSGFSQALIQKSNEVTEDDASTAFYVNLFLGFLIYILLFLSAPFIASFYNQPELVELSRVVFLIVFFNALTLVSRAKLTIVVDFKHQMIANFWGTIVASIVAVIMALKGYGYWALAANLLVKAIVSNFFIWVYCKWIPKLVFSKQSFDSLFSFGSKLLIGGIVSTLVNNAHAMLIGKFYNTKDVGLYNQANTTTSAVSGIVSSTLQSVTFPILTSIKNDRSQVVSIYKKLIKLTMFVSIPAFIGLASITSPLVRIVLGDAWIPVIPIIQIFCLNRLMTPVAVVNINVLNAIGRSDLAMRLEFFKIPFTLGTLLVSLPFGVIGVAWAAFFSTLFAFFINTYYQKTLFNFGALDQIAISIKFFIAAFLMYLANYFVNVSNPFLEVLIKLFLGTMVYIVSLLLLKDRTLFLVKNLIFRR